MAEMKLPLMPLLCNDVLVVELGQIILAPGGSGKGSSVEQIIQAANSVDQLQISNPNREEEKEEKTTSEEWLKEMRSSLMVVAALIATISFQAAANPPGGFYEPDPSENGKVDAGQRVGKAVLAQSGAYHAFMVCDFIGLFSSLCVILLLMSKEINKAPFLMNILVVVMTLSIISTGTAFLFLVSAIVPRDISFLHSLLDVFLMLWFVEVLYLAIWWKLVHRKWYDKYFLEKVGVDKGTTFGKISRIFLNLVLPVIIAIALGIIARQFLLPRIST